MSFPTTGVLDTFGGTLANWASYDGAGGVGSIVSGQLSFNVGGEHKAYYTPATYGPDSEVHLKIGTRPDSNDEEGIVLFLRTTSPGSGSVDGYAMRHWPKSGTDKMIIAKVVDNSYTNLSAETNQEMTNGDSIGFSAVGTTLTAWYKPAAGSWTNIVEISDSTYGGAGYLGVGGGTFISIKVDDFGGGTAVTSALKAGRGLAGLTGAGEHGGEHEETGYGEAGGIGSGFALTLEYLKDAYGTAVPFGSGDVEGEFSEEGYGACGGAGFAIGYVGGAKLAKRGRGVIGRT